MHEIRKIIAFAVMSEIRDIQASHLHISRVTQDMWRLALATKNITLAIDEDLLDKVRVIAALEKTTVNALVRDFLTETARKKDRTLKVRQRLVTRSRQSEGEIGEINWSRDELHER